MDVDSLTNIFLIAQGTENSKITARLESIERNVTTLLSNRISSKSNVSSNANNMSTNPITSDANIDTTNTSVNEYSSSTGITGNINIASTSSKATPPSPSTASSSTKQTPHDSLKNDIKHLPMQSNEAALDLSDKIDYLQEVNQAWKAQIATLKGQLEEQRSKTNKTRNLMANLFKFLEGYIQGGAKLEYQRTQKNQQVQVLSQRNTDSINQRIDTVEDQRILPFKRI